MVDVIAAEPGKYARGGRRVEPFREDDYEIGHAHAQRRRTHRGRDYRQGNLGERHDAVHWHRIFASSDGQTFPHFPARWRNHVSSGQIAKQ
jgi:hypothetical protein